SAAHHSQCEGATGTRHTTPRPGIYYGWLIVATTFWMAMFTGSGRSGFGVFVIPMSEALGWNRSTISLAAALGALISGLSQPFVGVSIVDGNLSCQHGPLDQIQNSAT